MALIKCPECGKEISDKAVSCPNCGSPINVGTYIPVTFKRIKKASCSLVPINVTVNGAVIGTATNGASFDVELSPGNYQLQFIPQGVNSALSAKATIDTLSIPKDAKRIIVEFLVGTWGGIKVSKSIQ